MKDIILRELNSITKYNKYTKWYISIIDACMTESYGIDLYCEKHHIIPKSFKKYIAIDILKSKDNLAVLPARQHFLAHLLLTKMFDNKTMNQKMNFAFHQMKLKNRHQEQRYINSRFYDSIKKEKREYIRLYMGEDVVYVNQYDSDHYNEMISLGYGLIMTEEYKKGRVGNMKGRKHSEESKQKMSVVQKSIPKTWLRGRKMSNETKEKYKNSITKLKEENPDRYNESIKKRTDKMKILYTNGTLSAKGDKNPMFGYHYNKEMRRERSLSIQKGYNNGLTIIEVCEKIIIPALLQSPMTMKEIMKLANWKSKRPHEIKKIISQADPKFNFDLILPTKMPPRTISYKAAKADSEQRRNNNGYNYEELYKFFISPEISPSTTLRGMREEYNLDTRALKSIITKFHPNGNQYWSELTSKEMIISQEIKDRKRYCGYTRKEFYDEFVHPHIGGKTNSEIIKISPVDISHGMIRKMIDDYSPRGV